MSFEWIAYASAFAGLCAALVAGVFQSFSDFVMAGLRRAAPAGGIEAMQQLNRTVFRSQFIFTFLALVPASLGLAIYAFFATDGTARLLMIAAAIVYFVTVFVVTIAGNVPMNERLDELVHTSAEAAAYWDHYGRVWTRWNTVRTIGSIVTAACYLSASLQLV
ncbi:MAG: anthrone oxygenase family protein [Pseudomonadota bacterium]